MERLEDGGMKEEEWKGGREVARLRMEMQLCLPSRITGLRCLGCYVKMEGKKLDSKL